jgi:hypothetical protein
MAGAEGGLGVRRGWTGGIGVPEGEGEADLLWGWQPGAELTHGVIWQF